ncbi:hypothetical protein BZA77DRAFT_355091 [Pyronema omphalodes]|nr:hypothetical protein BZA77DRAFT_355091 [Pyronema omphalodes]
MTLSQGHLVEATVDFQIRHMEYDRWVIGRQFQISGVWDDDVGELMSVVKFVTEQLPHRCQHRYLEHGLLECIDLDADQEAFLSRENDSCPTKGLFFCQSKEEKEKRWKWFHSFMSGKFMTYMWVQVTCCFCRIHISATRNDMMYDHAIFAIPIPICFHFLDTVEDSDYAIRKHAHPLQMDFHDIRAWEDLRAIVKSFGKKLLKRIILQDEEDKIPYSPKDGEDLWNYAVAAHVNPKFKFSIRNVYFRTMSCRTGIEAIVTQKPFPIRTTTIDDIRCFRASTQLGITYWKLPVVCIPCAVHPENEILKNNKQGWVILGSIDLDQRYQERQNLKHRLDDMERQYQALSIKEEYRPRRMVRPKNTIRDLVVKGVYGDETIDIRQKKLLPTLDHYDSFLLQKGSSIY